MSRRSEIFVVWMGGRVILMVDGPLPPDEDELVIECQDSLRRSGVAADEIDVIWQRPRVPA